MLSRVTIADFSEIRPGLLIAAITREDRNGEIRHTLVLLSHPLPRKLAYRLGGLTGDGNGARRRTCEVDRDHSHRS